jgi:hypothetical protein
MVLFMAKFNARIGVWNENDRPHVAWIEPWAEDFTLLSNESLEIHAYCDSGQPWFQVGESGFNTQVFLETIDGEYEGVEYEVTQNGNRLQGGHNRQAAIDAGIDV